MILVEKEKWQPKSPHLVL